MKTLQINLAVVVAFLLTSLSVNAQSTTNKSSSTTQRVEEKQKITLLNEIPATTKNSTTTSTPAPTTTRNTKRASEYLSMEKKIIEWSIAGEIPASLPKHIEGQTKEQYNAILKNWSKNNLNLIKKEYHKQILSDEKPVKQVNN